jgi:Domain of unknown function (DUF5668)/B-box zinc finger
MNCANHADASAVAYCRTCGKALCANCTRPVRGVIYCEDCLGAKMETPAQSTVYQQVTSQGGVSVPPVPGGGPNPALAGILGAIPFGVGAVYNGQYAKGLAHLIIFVLLVAGANATGRGSETLNVVCGLGIAAFIVYQIMDAVRSAQAIRAGLPPPDPFGLGQTFSTGEKIDASKIPTGAIVLIVLGGLFLLSTSGVFELRFHRVWPIAIILLGVWIFATRWGLIGTPTNCTCEMCRARFLMGPAILVTIGVVGMIDSFRDVSFFTYLGAVLLVIGGVKLFRNGASPAGHRQISAPGAGFGEVTPPPPVPPVAPVAPVPPVPPVPPAPPTSEVNRG